MQNVEKYYWTMRVLVKEYGVLSTEVNVGSILELRDSESYSFHATQRGSTMSPFSTCKYFNAILGQIPPPVFHLFSKHFPGHCYIQQVANWLSSYWLIY